MRNIYFCLIVFCSVSLQASFKECMSARTEREPHHTSGSVVVREQETEELS